MNDFPLKKPVNFQNLWNLMDFFVRTINGGNFILEYVP